VGEKSGGRGNGSGGGGGSHGRGVRWVAVTRDPLCAKGGKMVAVLMGHG
jgi:hypothetical protein